VGKALACQLNIKGSIPIPAMVFLRAFYGTNALPPPSRGPEEREREMIMLMNIKVKFKNRVKSIKSSLLKKSSYYQFFKTNLH
jgi:hypothetical protein